MELKSASTISKIFVFWMYNPIKLYLKSSPSIENMLKAPDPHEIKEMLHKISQTWSQSSTHARPSFTKTIIKSLYKPYLNSALLVTLGQVIRILQSLLINSMVEYIYQKDSSYSKALILSIIFIFSSFLIVLTQGISNYSSLLLSGKIKAALSLLITKKILKLNNSSLSKQDFTGKIFNTLSTDFEIFELIHYSLYVFSIPIVATVSIGVIYIYFDAIGIISIGIIVLHLPLIALISNISSKFREKAEKNCDTRVKMIERLIQGIKLMKFYVWEKKFYEKICEERKKEVKNRRKGGNFGSIILVLSDSGIIFNIFLTLFVFVVNGGSFTTNQYTFLVIILYNTHFDIVLYSNYGYSTLLSIFQLFDRVGEILLTEEHLMEKKTNLTLESVKPFLLKVKSLSVYHPSTVEPRVSHLNFSSVVPQDSNNSLIEEFPKLLSKVSFKLMKNEVILLTGRIGSGKSVLLQSLIQEFQSNYLKFTVHGKIAYLSSNPWLVSGTIRDNILMGREFYEDLYEKTVNSCALKQDFQNFLLKDFHVVGDQGSNLSGGQKARVCLARVVYSQADIFLLDDPLSAVDSSVANYIFLNCFKGLLKGKGLIIATHQIQFEKYADKIINLKNGEVEFFGRPNEFKVDDLKIEAEKETRKSSYSNCLNKKDKEINPHIEEKDEPLNVKIIWKFLKLSFKNLWIFLLFIIFFIATQVVYQSCFYYQTLWSSSTSQNSNYFIRACGTLTFICFLTFSLRIYVLANQILTCSEKVHDKALKGLVNTSISHFNSNPAGVILNRFTKDIGVIDGPLQVNFSESIYNGTNMIELIIISAMTVYLSVLIIPLWVISMYVIFKKILPVVLSIKNVEITYRGLVISSISSILTGITTIRNLDLKEKFYNDTEKLVFQHYDSFFTLQSTQRFAQFYADFISLVISSFSVVLILFLKSSLAESLASYCLISCFSSLGLSFYFAKSSLELSSSMSSVNRLLTYSTLPKEQNESRKILKFSSGSVIFSDIFMKYQPNLPHSLKGLNLSIKSRQKVGIVRRTGAGKSSIIQVLLRMVNPESGTIFIDGIDYQSIDLHCLRSQISIIPQSSTLFAVSLRENIDPFENYSDEQIWNALNEVGLKDVVESFDKKLDAVVDDDDVELSDGQAQLLCFARILLKENFVVVMDEATSNLDHMTDHLVQKMVKEKFRDKTLIVIAHRLLTVVDSDLICVMEEGKCVEFGKHEDLVLMENSVYRSLFEFSLGNQ